MSQNKPQLNIVGQAPKEASLLGHTPAQKQPNSDQIREAFTVEELENALQMGSTAQSQTDEMEAISNSRGMGSVRRKLHGIILLNAEANNGEPDFWQIASFIRQYELPAAYRVANTANLTSLDAMKPIVLSMLQQAAFEV